MLVFGMLTSLLMDALLAATAGPSAWRIMVGLPAVPGLVLAASLLFLPEVRLRACLVALLLSTLLAAGVGAID
jgi:hypothetical protein